MSKKQKIQDQINSLWKENNRNGIAIASVGVGKAKWIIDRCKELVQEHKKGKILVMTNSTQLRDEGFLQELDKWWDRTEFFNRCDIQCYATTYKWSGVKFLAVFADEFDMSLSPEFSKFYWNNSWDYFMGLSGTLTPEQFEIARRIAPMLFQYTVQQAQDEGLINKVRIIIHNVPLSWQQTMDTGKGFMTSEASNIKYWNRSIDELTDEVNVQKELIQNIQEQGWYAGMGIASVPSLKVILRSKTEHLKNKRMARARQFYNLKSVTKYALRLQEFLLNKHPDDKVIMFSKSVQIADELGPSYHSKNKNQENIDKFNTGENRVLSVVGSVSRGVSFENLKYAISHSMDGSSTNFIQREIGRMVRANPDEVATVHLLNPVINDYKTGIHQLQSRVWIEKATKGFEVEEMNIKQWWTK